MFQNFGTAHCRGERDVSIFEFVILLLVKNKHFSSRTYMLYMQLERN